MMMIVVMIMIVIMLECLSDLLGKASFRDAVNLADGDSARSEEHTSELQSRGHLVCRLLLEKKKTLCHLMQTDRDNVPGLCVGTGIRHLLKAGGFVYLLLAKLTRWFCCDALALLANRSNWIW